jgi:hypothetical protein
MFLTQFAPRVTSKVYAPPELELSPAGRRLVTTQRRHCSPGVLGNPRHGLDSAFHEPSVPPAPCPSPVYSCDRHLAKKMSQADGLLRTRSNSFTQCSGYTRLSEPARISPSATASLGQSLFLV